MGVQNMLRTLAAYCVHAEMFLRRLVQVALKIRSWYNEIVFSCMAAKLHSLKTCPNLWKREKNQPINRSVAVRIRHFLLHTQEILVIFVLCCNNQGEQTLGNRLRFFRNSRRCERSCAPASGASSGASDSNFWFLGAIFELCTAICARVAKGHVGFG